MEKSSSFIKWIGGILAAIITSVAVWYLTDGPGPETRIVTPDTVIMVTTPTETLKLLPLLGMDIKPGSSDIKSGKKTKVQISVYDRNNENKPMSNANVNVSVDDGSISEASGLNSRKYSGMTDKNGNLSFTFKAPVKTFLVRILGIKKIKINAIANVSINDSSYSVTRNLDIKITN